MPRLTKSTPRYAYHKPSGRARVRIDGQDIWLGKYGTAASREKYDRIVGEWIANGRQLPVPTEEITVTQLAVAYVKHAQGYYRKNGKQTDEVRLVKEAIKHVRRLYGRKPAIEFGPLALKATRESMMGQDWCRTHINKQVGRVRRMFKWAAGEEMVPASVHESLTKVDDLKRGRTTARESEGVEPVEDETIQRTLHYLPEVVADMVRFQRATGCRPGEVCSLRPCDVTAEGEVWVYQPESHKTEHHGKSRCVFIGPKAQNILRPYLLRADWDYCFSPRDSEKKRRSAMHEARTTPMSCGNKPGSNQKRRPKRTAGDCYAVASYRRAIHRAVDVANEECNRRSEKIERWSPNQLRHTAATEIRATFGLEAAQVVLGHAQAAVTQIYAERDMNLAAKVMKEVG